MPMPSVHVMVCYRPPLLGGGECAHGCWRIDAMTPTLMTPTLDSSMLQLARLWLQLEAGHLTSWALHTRRWLVSRLWCPSSARCGARCRKTVRRVCGCAI